MDDKEKLIAEADVFQFLVKSPGWELLVRKIAEETTRIEGNHMGKPITDPLESSFQMGRYDGLKKPLRIVTDIIQKAQEISKSD